MHVRDDGGSDRHLTHEIRERTSEVAALQRLRTQIHDGPSRFFDAVAQHLPRHVERLLRDIGTRLEAGRHCLELKRDTGEPLLERVVQLAAHASAFGQDRLVLLALSVRGGPDPDAGAAGKEREETERYTAVASRHHGDGGKGRGYRRRLTDL